MATFVVYIIIALTKHNNTILAAQAFTSLSLISILTTPMLTFIQAVPSIIQCFGCLDRIQEYASAPSLHEEDQERERAISKDDGSEISLLALHDQMHEQKNMIEFSSYSAGWKHGALPVMREVELNIQHGGITMVVGPIGSGKSTLLESILGEAVHMGGSIERNVSRVAYCSQTPWMQSDSIRNNIIGSSPTDMDWYATVVSACGLEKDLAELSRGDQTMVGNNGLTISGGQKQRIVSESCVVVDPQVYPRCRN